MWSEVHLPVPATVVLPQDILSSHAEDVRVPETSLHTVSKMSVAIGGFGR